MIRLDKKKCIKCFLCKNVCAFRAISESKHGPEFDGEKCANCGECVRRCPMGALEKILL